MSPDELDRLRKEWIVEVSEGVLSSSSMKEYPKLLAQAPISRCLIVLSVGAGHLLGVDAADLTFGDVLSRDEVVQFINHGWRGGDVNPDLAAWLLPSILSMLWAARRFESWNAAPNGQWFESSHLASRLSVAWGQGWATARDFETRLGELCVGAPSVQSLDELYMWLLQESRAPDILASFTPIEARLLGPDRHRDEAREKLESARADLYLWLSVPGAWPRFAGDSVPTWLRDTVASDGARLWRASAGYILTLTVIVETDRDEQSMRRWSYEPTLAMTYPTDSSVDLLIVLDIDDDPAYLPFSFNYDAYRTAQQLDVLLEVGLVRVECYRLHDDGTLAHLWNFGVPAVGLENLREHREQWSGTVSGRFDLLPSPVEVLAMIDQRQRAIFESTVPTIDIRGGAPRVISAWERRLQVLDDAASSFALGRPIDERILLESLNELRSAEASVRRTSQLPDSDSVKVGEALFHVSIKQNTGWYSAAVVYRGSDGELDGEILDLDLIDFERVPATLAGATAALVELLAPLRDLVERGVTDLLISAGLGAYGLPIQNAAMDLGFETASYSHSIRLVHRPPKESDVPGVAIFGFAGSGNEYIAAAAAELSIIRALTLGEIRADWRSTWPRVVHVAGHGIAGNREFEAGIFLEDDFLSAPAVLRSVDASATELAFLSACDSGAGAFDPGEVSRCVPLDVALIEKGCRSVVSTAAPVNDHVALVFATVFHHHFAAGSGAWASFREAQKAFVEQEFRVPGAVAELLDSMFPEWCTPLTENAMNTWRLFRFSGQK